MRVSSISFVASLALGTMTAAPAFAQTASEQDLMSMGDRELVDALTTLHQDGLSASLDESIIAANDSRYLWALETKVQCGIAIGFMKSSTRDETSIGNCARAHRRMQRVAAPPVAMVAPPPPPRQAICDEKTTGMVFFDFDSAVIRPDAQETLTTLAQQVQTCGRKMLSVVGHTDQAGRDDYNIVLSRQRAEVVAAAMRTLVGSAVAMNVDAQGERNPRVPLADGTRSPENRRVEISAE